MFFCFRPESIELPQDGVDYVDLAMSPESTLFVVDSCGGILRVNTKGTVTKPERITDADEDKGGRGIVYHKDGFLIVGNRRTGCLTRVDTKSGVRRPIRCFTAAASAFQPYSLTLYSCRIVPNLPSTVASDSHIVAPLGLVLLRDGRLAVLSAGRVHLLQDNGGSDGPWSFAHLIGSFRIADTNIENVMFSSSADPNDNTIFVLSSIGDELYQFYTIAFPQEEIERTSTS